jgi:hypothetical protein
MGLFSSIFGGSSSSSGNKSYDYLKGAYGGQVSTGTGANSLLASLLGVGGTPGEGQAGLQQYMNTAGYNSTIKGGNDAIMGGGASRGLARSGSTLKALSNFGQQTAQQYYGDYLKQLLGLSEQGTQVRLRSLPSRKASAALSAASSPILG